MYPEISIGLALAFVAVGLYVLTWSADRFVEGAEAVARALGVSPFIIGMVIVGFGTSAPELAVSALSGLAGHSNLSLGNAYGSNIFNIAAILGIAVLIRPIAVRPVITFGAVPMLLVASVASGLLVCLGGGFSRMDGLLCLALFAVLLPAYCFIDRKGKAPADAEGAKAASCCHPCLALVGGLMLLVASSHILVWGAVGFARSFGVSELLIGLTVIAAGTSLPELASAIASARRGQNELTLGNIIGSNFFNALAVVGTSGAISPFRDVSPLVFTRDLPVMVLLTLSIGIFGFNFRNPRSLGTITRPFGIIWLAGFIAYLIILIRQETFTA
ncbi:MAG: calcium/sodium antiporter [Kiritimatiellae bacterium]|nr:calcium/sodium antiporter [Kiritimatiellia bacterium]